MKETKDAANLGLVIDSGGSALVIDGIAFTGLESYSITGGINENNYEEINVTLKFSILPHCATTMNGNGLKHVFAKFVNNL